MEGEGKDKERIEARSNPVNSWNRWIPRLLGMQGQKSKTMGKSPSVGFFEIEVYMWGSVVS